MKVIPPDFQVILRIDFLGLLLYSGRELEVAALESEITINGCHCRFSVPPGPTEKISLYTSAEHKTCVCTCVEHQISPPRVPNSSVPKPKEEPIAQATLKPTNDP